MPKIAATEAVHLERLSDTARARLIADLYDVHRRIFDGVDQRAFIASVIASEARRNWLYIHKSEGGAIVGYCALHLFERTLANAPVTILRAHAGTLSAYRGSRVNSRCALRAILRTLLTHPCRATYFLGCFVHPSSYAVAARFAEPIWPSAHRAMPPAIAVLMLELAREFALEPVHGAHSLVHHAGWITRESERDIAYWQSHESPAVRYFLTVNPSYTKGHGLLSLIPLTLGHALRASVRYAAARRPRAS
jgi:hypothetical protein